MEKPSKNWNGIRQAVLDRARRSAIEPLEPLFKIHAAVCIYYVVGCMYFQLFDRPETLSLIESIQLLTVALAGILVPVLTGTVFTLHFASERLQKLARE